MSNDWFVASGNPATKSHGSSAVMRSEFGLIEQLAEKLPPLTGNAGAFVVVNASANGLRSISGEDARQALGLKIGEDVQAHSEVLDETTAAFKTGMKDKLDLISVSQAVNLDNLVRKSTFEVDHKPNGKHNQVTLPQLASDPSVGVGEIAIYSKQHDGQAEAYIKDGQGNVIRISNQGELLINLGDSQIESDSVSTGSVESDSIDNAGPITTLNLIVNEFVTGKVRGKAIDVQISSGVALIDLDEAEVFRLTVDQDCDIEIVGTPTTSGEEIERTVYIDLVNGGNHSVGYISSGNTIRYRGDAVPELTEDGRDVLVVTANDGSNVLISPALNMGDAA